MICKTLTLNKPTLLLDSNPKRKKLRIQMQATDVDVNNVGKIFIGCGSQPTPTVGHQSQGEILLQASAIETPSGGDVIDEKYKMAIWAVSDTEGQTIVFDEEISE